MDEERIRKIGAASGMVHALVRLKREIGEMTYHPINPRHTKKIRERDMRVAPLRKMYERIEADLRRLQSHLAE